MSTVEYRCPDCGHRLFAEPHSPIKYPCPNVGVEYTDGDGRIHQEAIMVQVEEFQGPNFLFKDIGEAAPGKTGIVTQGATGGDLGATNVTPVLVMSKPVEMTEEEELEFLRKQFERITRQPADRRYKAPRLRQEIEDLERAATPEPSETVNEDMEALRAEFREEFKQEFKASLLDELRAELLAELKGENGDARE